MDKIVLEELNNNIRTILSHESRKLVTMIAIKYCEDEAKDHVFIDPSDHDAIYTYNGHYLEHIPFDKFKRRIVDWFISEYIIDDLESMDNKRFMDITLMVKNLLEQVECVPIIHLDDTESQIINTSNGYFDLNKNEIVSCEKGSISPCPFRYIFTDSIEKIREINLFMPAKLINFMNTGGEFLTGEVELNSYYSTIENHY